MEILVFGGTVEGRELVEWLDGLGVCEVISCAATEYGAELVDGMVHVRSIAGPLDAEAKARLVDAHDFACIVDATHPYATHVTQSIAELAAARGLPLLRLQRAADAEGAFTPVDDVAQAAAHIAAAKGPVLLTTGVKDLPTFVQAVPDFAERLYVRILPVESSVARARELGIPASHIVAMQGPFSRQMNCAILRQFGIATMVTKASGAAGGFQDKIDAAADCGAELVVIARPDEQPGLSFDEVKAKLADMMGVKVDGQDRAEPCSCSGRGTSNQGAAGACGSDGAELRCPDAAKAPAPGDFARSEDARGRTCQEPADAGTSTPDAALRRVNLVGIGLGNPDTLTVEAVKAIEGSDLLIGAARMLEPYVERPCAKRALIKTADIVEALASEHYRCASVLFSGDVGFYSGATNLAAALDGVEGLDVRAIPGISSVVCFCARLFTPWQDVHLVSAHGRACDPVAEVRGHAKTFMLTGGQKKVRDVCALLAEAGLGALPVYVGERLSYDDERITHGTAAELAGRDFCDLAVMLVENPAVPKHVPGELEQ